MRCFVLLSLAPLMLLCPRLAANPSAEAGARLVTETGTVLAQDPGPEPWHWKPLKKNEGIPCSRQLIGMESAVIESLNGAVQLTTRTDLTNRSPLPIIENAIRLNPAKEVDLDFWLDRGRVDLINHKKSGSAKVRIHFRTRVWDVVLEKPGTRIAMEIFGRWVPGTRFNPDEKSEGPLTTVMLMVLNGEVTRSCPNCTVALSAPPGPAQFAWDNIHGDDSGAKKLEKLPEWVKDVDPNSPREQLSRKRREAFRQLVVERGLGAAILELLDSKDPEMRRVGVYALGAFDQLPSLAALLSRSKDVETWNHAVVALRHWLGRAPGQEMLLFEGLKNNRDFRPVDARNAINLLIGFNEEDAARPELYSVLIDLLKHEKLPIRGLAYWHLRRLAPGVKVNYDPTSSEQEREKARQSYLAAIPRGKLPPPLTIPDEKK